MLVDLWSGLGGLLVATLALGLRCIVVSTETDIVLRKAKAKLLPNVVILPDVKDIDLPVVAKRNFDAILLAGIVPHRR